MRYCSYFLILLCGTGQAAASDCYGTTRQGRLTDGVQLPERGSNFESYGRLPSSAGRTYVHRQVQVVVVAAYRMLENEAPQKVFKYAETGFKQGGPFPPHKTHQNGLSVDFMVPVLDRNGQSVHLPTHPFNKYGYAIEFNAQSQYDVYTIDYEAMSAHIVALHKSAKQRGIGIWRVIFDPMLVAQLYRTRHGAYIKQHIHIPVKPSWVRHDEHYHVDFILPCKPM